MWIKALEIFFKIITDDSYSDIKNIKMSYNSIRPRGERLKTFGGTASGYETIKDMFIGIDNVLKDKLDITLEPMKEIVDVKDDIHIGTGKFEVRPIHILDIINLIGVNVVCGGEFNASN